MIRRRSVAIELRLRADAEAKKAAKEKLRSIMIRFTTGTLAGRVFILSESILSVQDQITANFICLKDNFPALGKRHIDTYYKFQIYFYCHPSS